MNWKTIFLTTFCFLFLVSFSGLYAQDYDNDGNDAILATVTGSLNIPIAKLNDRFGLGGSAGFHLSYKFNNWLIGAEGNFLGARKVKEDDILKSIATIDEGLLIDQIGGLQLFGFNMRGMLARFKLGKIIPFNPKSPDSGLMIEGGIGIMQHRINIEADLSTISALNDNYIGGYERLSRGPVLSQFVGWMVLKERRFINFYIGLEFVEGITSQVAPWNFDTNTPGETGRFDMYIGLKLGWVIPKFMEATNEFYYD